ncbi:hypothetical protein ABK040_005163 [Willaertia magna]
MKVVTNKSKNLINLLSKKNVNTSLMYSPLLFSSTAQNNFKHLSTNNFNKSVKTNNTFNSLLFKNNLLNNFKSFHTNLHFNEELKGEEKLEKFSLNGQFYSVNEILQNKSQVVNNLYSTKDVERLAIFLKEQQDQYPLENILQNFLQIDKDDNTFLLLLQRKELNENNNLTLEDKLKERKDEFIKLFNKYCDRDYYYEYREKYWTHKKRCGKGRRSDDYYHYEGKEENEREEFFEVLEKVESNIKLNPLVKSFIDSFDTVLLQNIFKTEFTESKENSVMKYLILNKKHEEFIYLYCKQLRLNEKQLETKRTLKGNNIWYGTYQPLSNVISPSLFYESLVIRDETHKQIIEKVDHLYNFTIGLLLFTEFDVKRRLFKQNYKNSSVSKQEVLEEQYVKEMDELFTKLKNYFSYRDPETKENILLTSLKDNLNQSEDLEDTFAMRRLLKQFKLIKRNPSHFIHLVSKIGLKWTNLSCILWTLFSSYSLAAKESALILIPKRIRTKWTEEFKDIIEMADKKGNTALHLVSQQQNLYPFHTFHQTVLLLVPFVMDFKYIERLVEIENSKGQNAISKAPLAMRTAYRFMKASTLMKVLYGILALWVALWVLKVTISIIIFSIQLAFRIIAGVIRFIFGPFF